MLFPTNRDSKIRKEKLQRRKNQFPNDTVDASIDKIVKKKYASKTKQKKDPKQKKY